MILKQRARHLAYEKGFEEEYNMLCSIERLAPASLPRKRAALSLFAPMWTCSAD